VNINGAALELERSTTDFPTDFPTGFLFKDATDCCSDNPWLIRRILEKKTRGTPHGC
jgi:hypothetical protein